MKQSIINTFKIIIISSLAFGLTIFFSGCDGDDPKKENTPELITKVRLTFTPVAGGTPIIVTATDPDGEGVQDIAVDGPINLQVNKTYTLAIELINELADPSDPEYNITAEVEEEADEHIFFFAWTNNVFSNPAGNGNVDNRTDPVNYNDVDSKGLPLGLSTNWTTIGSSALGTFRIILKHQPGLKSATSSVSVGETDLDLTFDIHIN